MTTRAPILQVATIMRDFEASRGAATSGAARERPSSEKRGPACAHPTKVLRFLDPGTGVRSGTRGYGMGDEREELGREDHAEASSKAEGHFEEER
jgi:hypothetical protein